MKKLYILILLSVFSFSKSNAQCTIVANAKFVANDVCLSVATQFTDSTSGEIMGVNHYSWDFENDGIVDDTTFGSTSFLFDTSGVFTARLVVYDSIALCGDTAYFTFKVVDNNKTITVSGGCAGSVTTLSFNNQIDTTGTNFFWDIDGDGVADDSTKNSISYNVAMADTYYVDVVINNTLLGCIDSLNNFEVIINDLPRVLAFSDTTVCSGNPLFLKALGANTYAWTDTTGLISDTSLSNPQLNTMFAFNDIDFIVIGTDTNGCVNKDTATVTILKGPKALFSMTSACLGMPTEFVNLSFDTDSSTVYEWDFNADLVVDDTTAGNQYFVYELEGENVASLTATSSNGCSTTYIDTTIVAPNPLSVSAGYDRSLVCGDKVQIVANSNLTGVTYSWTPSNLVSNPYINNPNMVPDTTTEFIVKATKGSCSRFDTVIVNVTPITADAGVDMVINCGSSVQIKGNTNGVSGTIYQWTPGDGLTTQTALTTTATPTDTMQYVLTTYKNTCKASDTMMVFVKTLPLSAGSDKFISCGQSASLAASISGGSGTITYQWSPVEFVANPNVSTTTATPDSTKEYIVTATKGACTASDTLVINVTPFTISAGNDKSLDCGATSQLVASSAYSSGVTYSWSPAEGLSNPYVLSPTFSGDTTTLYTLHVLKSGTKCKSSDSVLVTVNNNIAINVAASKTVFSNSYPPYQVTFTNTTTNYKNLYFTWNFGDTTTSNVTAPKHDYQKGGTFDVIVIAKSANGRCSDTLKLNDYIVAWGPNSIRDVVAENAISVSPNPSKNVFNISLNMTLTNAKFEVYDAKGSKLNNVDINTISNDKLSIDLASQDQGLYILLITDGNRQMAKRLIKE